MATRRVDGYLSRRCQQLWPGSLVHEEGDGSWTLERLGLETLGLGDNFSSARQAVDALAASERQKKEERS